MADKFTRIVAPASFEIYTPQFNGCGSLMLKDGKWYVAAIGGTVEVYGQDQDGKPIVHFTTDSKEFVEIPKKVNK